MPACSEIVPQLSALKPLSAARARPIQLVVAHTSLAQLSSRGDPRLYTTAEILITGHDTDSLAEHHPAVTPDDLHTLGRYQWWDRQIAPDGDTDTPLASPPPHSPRRDSTLDEYCEGYHARRDTDRETRPPGPHRRSHHRESPHDHRQRREHVEHVTNAYPMIDIFDDMEWHLLLQRELGYGLLSGGVTTGVIVLIAFVANVSLGLTATVVLFVAIIALSLLLGAPGIGPGSAVAEGQGQQESGYISNPTEGGGASRNPADLVIVPDTRLGYVMYFLGLGIVAAILIVILLD
jgi:hypothetical protein